MLRGLWEGSPGAGNVSCRGEDRPAGFLKGLNPAWNLVGRVHFNLAENRSDDEAPFAFLATYTTRLSAQARAQHLPLGQALREYAGAANRERCCRCCCRCSAPPSVRVAEGDGRRGRDLTTRCAGRRARRFNLLTDVPDLEAAGVIVRVPPTWRANRPPRPQVTATVGRQAAVAVLARTRCSTSTWSVTLDGETADAEPRSRALLAGADGLALVRGRWVEVDREQARARMLDEFRRGRANGGATTASPSPKRCACSPAPRAGRQRRSGRRRRDWSRVVAGPWLAETLQACARPMALARVDPGAALHGTLRPYQQVGVRWLHLLSGARPGRLPRRRHGPRQDDPGAGAAAGAASAARREPRRRACWWRRRRCWPTGRRRSSASRRPRRRSSRIRRR